MHIGIAGAGAIAMGYAGFLLSHGHAAHVWSPSGKSVAGLLKGTPLTVTGAIEGEFDPWICSSAKELAKCDVIIVALPAYGHRMVLDSLVPHIDPHHTIIISGHLSFAALYLAKRLSERSIEIPIGVWNTTLLTSKAQSSTHIRIGAIRAKVDMAVLPVRRRYEVQAICVALFGDRFLIKDDMLTIALSNLNPQNHMGIALCNLTRIERGEAWGQNTNVTPAVARLLEGLDRERLGIAAAFGKTVRTIFDHSVLSHGVSGSSVAEVYANLAQQGKDPVGPKDINTRYVVEDVPFGLITTLYLARMCGVEALLHESGAAILSACYGRDFGADNDILPELGSLDRTALTTLVVEGYPVSMKDVM